jgi:hypothetical protein
MRFFTGNVHKYERQGDSLLAFYNLYNPRSRRLLLDYIP